MGIPVRLVGGLLALSLTACAPQRGAGPSAAHGFEVAGQGIAQLLTSPVLIAAGLLEGLVALPYALATDLHAVNRELVDSGAPVDLTRTYRYAYEAEFEKEPAPGVGRAAFRHLDEASAHFRHVLAGYGVEDHESYLLTAVRTADEAGFTLFAVVRRTPGPIQVPGAAGVMQLDASDPTFYRPYSRDAAGRPLDVVIDWAGVPRAAIRTRKEQAVLMTIAAHSVLTNRRSEAYWRAERRWRSGAYRTVVAERDAHLKRRLDSAG